MSAKSLGALLVIGALALPGPAAGSVAPGDLSIGRPLGPYVQAPAALERGVELGIANDEYGFIDPSGVHDVGERFLDHPLLAAAPLRRRVRRIVPYNAALVPDARASFGRFYERAVAKRMEILVSFQFRDARIPRRETRSDRRRPPSRLEYLQAFGAFRRAFPLVRLYSAWNEPNHPSQPTSRTADGPERAAGYTLALQEACGAGRLPRPEPHCDVVAADLSTEGPWVRYLRRYAHEVVRLSSLHGAPLPQIWAAHPYRDVWELTDERTRRFVRIVEEIAGSLLPPPAPHIWLTELGSRLRPRSDFPGRSISLCRQAREVVHLLGLAAGQAERVYYYQWREPSSRKALRAWDSGVLSPAGRARPAYEALRRGTVPAACR